MSWLDPFMASINHGQQPSFHPLLPLRFPTLPPRPTTPTQSAKPPKPFVCPLPPLGSITSRPPFAVGHGAHLWSEHFAWLAPPNKRGQRLFIQSWLPPVAISSHSSNTTAPKAVVHLIHGLSAHGSHYAHLARELVAAGYAVVAHDAHGHGRSDGYRGHATSIQHYVDDAKLAVSEACRRLPAATEHLPRVLLGHSVGGAVAIHLAAAAKPCEWAGVVLTAPAVTVYSNPLLRLFAPVIATFAPLMRVQRVRFDRSRNTSRENSASTDAGFASMPAHDPLIIRGPIRAKVGYEILKSCVRIMQCAPSFRVPVFVAHSKGDRVTGSQGSLDFVARIGSKDKVMKFYDGHMHDLLAARGRQHKAVVSDIVDWMDERVQKVKYLCVDSSRKKSHR